MLEILFVVIFSSVGFSNLQPDNGDGQKGEEKGQGEAAKEQKQKAKSGTCSVL